MTGLTILTFGGFELHRDGTRVSDLESRKVQALAAFLIAHRGQGYGREYLASLLWPERDGETSRRNLRQALYNLRSTLESGGPPLFRSESGCVRFEPEGEYWLDLEAFERILPPSRSPTTSDVQELVPAVRLYRGDFLAGLQVPESLEFEDWLVQEQERLREAVLGALRDLVDHYLAMGGYSLGISYARRLLELDPLSEETHRKLMRLYALSGRRSRALAQFDSLEKLLAEELDVEPLEETVALYHRLRAEGLPRDEPRTRDEPQGPLLPLVGRREPIDRLDRILAEVTRGRGRLVWVEGAEGSGKTRLVRTFLHGATSRPGGALVLHGKSFEIAPLEPFGVVAEAFGNALTHETEAAERVFAAASGELLRCLAPLVPPLNERARLPSGRPLSEEGAEAAEPPSMDELAGSVAETLELLSGDPGGGGSGPVILFLDDLHWADRSSLELLAELAPRLDGLPVLLVAVAQQAAAVPPAGRATPADLERLAGGAGVERVAVEALETVDLTEIARALVGPDDALEELLVRQSGGLPASVAELINLLWDLGCLEPGGGGHWRLTEPVAEAATFPPANLAEILEARLLRLPPSSRRLVTLAAVAGPRFDTGLLGRIEGEDPAVVEASMRLLLGRWLVRLHLGYWADSRQDRDLTLWAGSTPGARFELAHDAFRRAVYGALDVERRRLLHGKVAAALSRRRSGEPVPAPELLAHHLLGAGTWETALENLLAAAGRARALGARAVAEAQEDRARAALAQLEAEAPDRAAGWAERLPRQVA